MRALQPLVMAFLSLLSVSLLPGCFAPVHRDDVHYPGISQDKAIQLVRQLGVSAMDGEMGGGSDFWPMESVDSSSFTWVIGKYFVYETTKEGTSSARWVRPFPRKVDFATVTSIKMDWRPNIVPGTAHTYNILLYHDGVCTRIDCSVNPSKRDEYIAALLVLCPNVK